MLYYGTKKQERAKEQNRLSLPYKINQEATPAGRTEARAKTRKKQKKGKSSHRRIKRVLICTTITLRFT
jgi:hypothetical protein